MIKYNVIKRKSPKDGSMKYYAQASKSTHMTMGQVAENISRECTVTIHDIKAVLSALEEQIILALYDGKSIRFGDLGSFHLTVKSKGAASKDEFKTADISKVMVRFVRSSQMRSAFALTNSNLRIAREGEKSEATSGSGSGSSEVKPNA